VANMKVIRKFFPLSREIKDPFTKEDWKMSREKLEKMFESDIIKFEWDHF
jgi:hypothetical protein